MPIIIAFAILFIIFLAFSSKEHAGPAQTAAGATVTIFIVVPLIFIVILSIAVSLSESSKKRERERERTEYRAAKALEKEALELEKEALEKEENKKYAATLTVLKDCAVKSMGGINGIHVVSTRRYSATKSGIVLNDDAYRLVFNPEQSMYEDIALSGSIAKTCWVESDSSARGISVNIVTSEGLLIVKDSK